MALIDILNDIANSPIGHSISKSDHLVGAAAQVFHVLGFVLLLASLVLINLRLLGVIFKNQAIQDVAGDGKRIIWIGFTSAVVSGILMFLSVPVLYYGNPAFRLKLLLLLGALLVQLTLHRRVTTTENPSPLAAKLAVGLSITLWFGVGLAGRAIGFV